MRDPRLEYMEYEEYRVGVCIHEAAHADYMEQIGDVYVSFIPLPEDESYRHCDALVTNGKTESEDVLQMKTNPLGYVKSILAAGIAEEVLTGKPADGTALDNEEIAAVFDSLGVPNEERRRLRKRARADILKDLRSPAFRKRLWARARFYQRILEQTILEKMTEQQMAA